MWPKAPAECAQEEPVGGDEEEDPEEVALRAGHRQVVARVFTEVCVKPPPPPFSPTCLTIMASDPGKLLLFAGPENGHPPCCWCGVV